MPREIKFRAWVNVPNANTMLQDINLEELWMSGRAYENYGTSRYETEDISGIKWTFKDLIFMQYTGAKDCKGVEIFEGDILKIEDVGVAQVMMKEGRWVTYLEDCDEVCASLYGWLVDCKIIGNIYEHPRLLGQKV